MAKILTLLLSLSLSLSLSQQAFAIGVYLPNGKSPENGTKPEEKSKQTQKIENTPVQRSELQCLSPSNSSSLDQLKNQVDSVIQRTNTKPNSAPSLLPPTTSYLMELMHTDFISALEVFKKKGSVSAAYLLNMMNEAEDLPKRRSESNLEWMNKEFPKGNEDLLFNLLSKEVELRNQCSFFYHGAGSAVSLARYMVNQINKRYQQEMRKNSLKKRYTAIKNLSNESVSEFLKKYYEKKYDNPTHQRERWDHQSKITSQLLAVSPVIENYVGGESAWYFFFKNENIKQTYDSANIILAILDKAFGDLGIDKGQINGFMEIYKKYSKLISPELLQFCIKNEFLEDFVYLSLPGGLPLLTHDFSKYMKDFPDHLNGVQDLMNYTWAFRNQFWSAGSIWIPDPSPLLDVLAPQARILINHRDFYDDEKVKVFEYFSKSRDEKQLQAFKVEVKNLVNNLNFVSTQTPQPE